MSEKIVFASQDKIGFVNDKKVLYLNSKYLEKYNKNRLEIKNKSAWKSEGKGALFMGVYNEMQNFDPIHTRANINGVVLLNNSGRILYTISVNEMSGIFIKNIEDFDTEEHVVHKSNTEFSSLDYNNLSQKLVVSIREESIEKHLALLDIKTGQYSFITEGESIDENPSWSKINNQVIYYESSGISVDSHKAHLGISPKFICKLDIEAGSVEEVIANEKYDYLKPKENISGDLYCIKRPHRENTNKSLSFVDVMLLPFRVIKALFGWLNFFTMRYSGESLSSGGMNPAKTKDRTPEEIFIEGNLINVEKTMKENKNSGEKYPGVAPRSWELVKVGQDGKLTTVKKSVMDFDFDNEGRIIYSNGTYLIRILEDMSEEIVGKANLATNIRI